MSRFAPTVAEEEALDAEYERRRILAERAEIERQKRVDEFVSSPQFKEFVLDRLLNLVEASEVGPGPHEQMLAQIGKHQAYTQFYAEMSALYQSADPLARKGKDV